MGPVHRYELRKQGATRLAILQRTLKMTTPTPDFLRNLAAAERMEGFKSTLHKSTRLISEGVAQVMGNVVAAIEVQNLYGQRIVWGMFSVERGKWRGRLSNNAATEGVIYTPAAFDALADEMEGK